MVSGEGLDAHVKTGWSHQQGSQEDRDRTGRGTGGSGGQEKLVDSCRPVRLRRRMNQERGPYIYRPTVDNYTDDVPHC